MSKETCYRCNRQLAQVERAIGHTCKPTPEYCDKIEADRDAALAMVRELREALELSTKQLDAMNQSASHAASWVEPKSGDTTFRVNLNYALIAKAAAINV